MKQTANNINQLGKYLAPRDIKDLTTSSLNQNYNINQADIFVLFGGSIICGGDVLAEAIKQKIAKHYIIVGGAGHTTETLREIAHFYAPQINTFNKSEAEIFNEYIYNLYGVKADYTENKSTNCGNNITNLIKLIEEKNISCSSIIICQDATMQLRMYATLKKYKPEITIINYASYQVNVLASEKGLRYDQDIKGMWNMDRYITLLMGEIPRLTDNAEGYGPKGKNYLAHIDIPENITIAFNELKKIFVDKIRIADPIYSSND